MVGLSVGRIRKILVDRGYGFIQIHGLSRDVFFHANNFKDASGLVDKKIFSTLKESQFLSFKCSEVDGKLRASDCFLLSDAEVQKMRDEGELDF